MLHQMATQGVTGLKSDTDTIELIQSYGFCYDVACTANSILYLKKRSKKDMKLKQFEAIYEAHNKLNKTIDTFTIIERMSLSKRLKIQPEAGCVRIRKVQDYVIMYLDTVHLEKQPEEKKSEMLALAAKLDEGDGLPALAPDAAVAVIRYVLLKTGAETISKKLGRPNMSVNQAYKYLLKELEEKKID